MAVAAHALGPFSAVAGVGGAPAAGAAVAAAVAAFPAAVAGGGGGGPAALAVATAPSQLAYLHNSEPTSAEG